MTEQYMPSTEDVRESYGWGIEACGCCVEEPEKYFPDFDRWLATIKAEAWQEGYDGQGGPTNPYRPTSTRRNKTMTDNRTNEPTEARVEAAAVASINSHRSRAGLPTLATLDGVPNADEWRDDTRAALKAVARAQHNTERKNNE